VENQIFRKKSVTLASPKLLALGNVRKKAGSFARIALVFA